MRERLQDYALFAEIIGAIAIVVSLLFVGVQVRQSNSIATTDAIKDGTQIWTTAYHESFGTEASTAFFRKAINRCDELSDDERGRFFVLLGHFISAFDNIYNQYVNDRLPEEIFVSISLTYYGIVNTPCAQQAMTRDYLLLPPWLLSSAGIEVLISYRDQMKLPTFVAE
jgi:hypothetical protein